ncbi:hypothetical protein [Rosistilla oblonga]|uniref:hypothetical protein n=1 Tax=Rosistilla oblonga TaxID=2527990 RepID=UPI003A9814E7
MAWRPSDWVLEGELDNRTLDWTVGWIRLRDREEPLQLKLLGNCHPDLAGWKFQIVRTDPIPDWVGEPNYDGIATDQSGTIGDITADQVLRHYECSSKEFVRRSYAGETPPTTLRKSLYLEWYSNLNGRVVIQDTRLGVKRIGERGFELTQQQWRNQAKQNREEIYFFLGQVGDAIGNHGPGSGLDAD